MIGLSIRMGMLSGPIALSLSNDDPIDSTSKGLVVEKKKKSILTGGPFRKSWCYFAEGEMLSDNFLPTCKKYLFSSFAICFDS